MVAATRIVGKLPFRRASPLDDCSVIHDAIPIFNRMENGAWKEPLWQTLADAGLPLAWVPEKLGGSGASLAEGFAILGVAGRFALAVPLAETLAAGWLLARAGLEAPAAPVTLAPARPDERSTIGAGGTLSL